MLDMTSFNDALKEMYTPEAVEDMTYKDNPFYALIPKNKSMKGLYEVVPIIFGNPQGRSASFSRAQTRAAATSSKIERFAVTRVKDYSLAHVDNETILASEGDVAAFMEAASVEYDGAINAAVRSIATAMYRSGYGSIGVVGTSGVSTTTITLSNTEDITNFEVGMELVVADSEGASTLRTLGSSGNGLIVTAINRSTGVLTFGANVTDATNGIPGTTDADHLFVRGDREDSATPSRLKLAGFTAWCPQSAPSSTAFFGVNRAVDATRLGGQRYDGRSMPIEEALIEGAALVAREGFKLDTYFMNYSNYTALEKALGSKVQYVDLAANARIAFRGIRVNGPRGEINIVPDQNCPPDTACGVKLDSWKLGSIGDPVRVIDTDGLEMLRLASSDGVEARWGFYGNMYCNAPGANINLRLR